MANCSIKSATVFEDSGVILMARIVNDAGTLLTQATTTSITCKSYDTSDPTGTPVTPTVVVASVIFDTLQTPDIWTEDSTGYNFKHVLPATAIPNGDRTYQVEYKITPTSGEAFYLVFQLQTIGILST
jgi:hypothetical protein